MESQRLLPLERAGVWVRNTGKEGLAASCGVCRTTMRCSWAYPGTRANSLGWSQGRPRTQGQAERPERHQCLAFLLLSLRMRRRPCLSCLSTAPPCCLGGQRRARTEGSGCPTLTAWERWVGSRRKEENKHMERSGLLAVQVQCSFSPDDFVALNCHLKTGSGLEQNFQLLFLFDSNSAGGTAPPRLRAQ